MIRVDVGGTAIHAYSGARVWRKDSPWLVFVHGAGNDHSVWMLQSRYFAHHGWNVCAVDLPGHGRSDGAPLQSVEALAGWLAALQDAVHAPRATLVGHSMGALAALQCAATHPDRVERLALLGPAVPMEVNDDLMTAARHDVHLAYELINGWSFGGRGRMGGNAMPGMWMAGAAMRLLERNAAGVLASDLAACRDYAGGLAAAARVRCPVLAIVGGRDLMAPGRNARALAAALTDVTTVRLEQSGHALMAEEPDAVLAALHTFLGTR